ncbi:MAG TPA: hypothetical protein VK856_11250, partial [Anaerolineaceae bacterium]|nr:hypothetical protein [Anaerolineaceae bacterium]
IKDVGNISVPYNISASDSSKKSEKSESEKEQTQAVLDTPIEPPIEPPKPQPTVNAKNEADIPAVVEKKDEAEEA